MTYSLETTCKTIRQMVATGQRIPAGTPVNIAFLGNETHAQRYEAARLIRECGFAAVPIISARRLGSGADAAEVISGYQKAASPERFMFVGGDPASPQGPFRDAMALMESGVIQRFGIRSLNIAGYPEGHPAIPTSKLWDALKWKRDFLGEHDVDYEITTQFVLDPDCIGNWLGKLRAEGISAPVRIGIPAPSPARRLLNYARQFGTRIDPPILEAYGMPADDSQGHVDPGPFLSRLRSVLEGIKPGSIDTHLYPFDGIAAAVEWANGLPVPLPEGASREGA